MTGQLLIAGKTYGSRLLLGKAEYQHFQETRAAIAMELDSAQIL